MKRLIKKALPGRVYKGLRSLKRASGLARSSFYDFSRYASHSAAINEEDDEAKLRALITATYHNIEKGLSLPEPRLGFGRQNLARLVAYIEDCLRRFGPRDYLAVPISVIGAYVDFHERRAHDVGSLYSTWRRLESRNAVAANAAERGGTREVSRAEILSAVEGVTPAFFEKRYSCRQFADEPVTAAQIETAVKAAQKCPVVCNRQSGRVLAYVEPADIQAILQLQGGARGFAQGVRALLCVTVDLRNFHGVGERYQGWIDGGLFAMSLIHGLHMQGIGSCCLNWSKDAGQDKAMRQLIGIPPHETIIMFVAAGHLPEKLHVAMSVRKPLSEILELRSLAGSRSTRPGSVPTASGEPEEGADVTLPAHGQPRGLC